MGYSFDETGQLLPNRAIAAKPVPTSSADRRLRLSTCRTLPTLADGNLPLDIQIWLRMHHMWCDACAFWLPSESSWNFRSPTARASGVFECWSFDRAFRLFVGASRVSPTRVLSFEVVCGMHLVFVFQCLVDVRGGCACSVRRASEIGRLPSTKGGLFTSLRRTKGRSLSAMPRLGYVSCVVLVWP